MSIQVLFRCSAENCDVGKMSVHPGDRIDVALIRREYQADEGYELNMSELEDGVQLLCPKCRNPVVIRADTCDLYFVPGMVQLSEKSFGDEAN